MKTRDRNPFKPGTDAAFFWRESGYSWDPITETPARGRKRCAAESADAEIRGRDAGLSFEWSIDPYGDSTEFAKGQRYSLWQCFCHDSSGRIVSSLHGIDFGRDRDPWADPYRRVVEAGLAKEALQ
jgi:hypothetical protein